MNHVAKKQGFTLIELMLAMGFVSVLLIAIAMTVMQIGNIYNRGLTLKEVNQAGRSLASELQRSIAEGLSFDITKPSHYLTQPTVGAKTGGRLCTGQYSYIWNYGTVIKPNDTSLSPNLYTASDKNTQIRFVKVVDPGMTYCITSPLKSIDLSNSTELLNAGEHDLVIHDFTISAVASAGDDKTGQQLYSIDFLIGTNDQTTLTTLNGDPSTTRCLAPGEVLSGKTPDPSYCSVNKFDVIVRAGNAIQ